MGILFILLCILLIITLYLYHCFPYPASPQSRIYDYALILGYICQEDGSLDEIARRRIRRAAELYQKGQCTKLVISGGTTGRNHNEAEKMGAYALELGIPEEALILEKQARNTFDNFRFSAQLINPDASICIITSRFHVRRSAFFARKFLTDFTFTYPLEERFSLRDALLEYFRMWNSLYYEIKLKKASERG